MKTIDVETLRAWLEEGRPVSVLDVRPTAERAEWAIPGSIHVDAYDALQTNDPQALAGVELPGDIPVVTVCGAGKTSLVAAQQLQERGIEALSLEGGMKAWSLAWNIAEVPLSSRQARVIQVRRTGKGCLSYLIGDGNTAVVIDASLDPRVYLNLAYQYGWQIERVLDTHIHADLLSRSRSSSSRGSISSGRARPRAGAKTPHRAPQNPTPLQGRDRTRPGSRFFAGRYWYPDQRRLVSRLHRRHRRRSDPAQNPSTSRPSAECPSSPGRLRSRRATLPSRSRQPERLVMPALKSSPALWLNCERFFAFCH